MLKRGAFVGMIMAILGIAAVAGAGSTAAAKPASNHRAPCAKTSKSKAKQAKRRTKCKKGTAQTVAAEVTSLLQGIPEEHEQARQPRRPRDARDVRGSRVPGLPLRRLYTLPTIIKEFVRPGKLKIEYHSFQSATIEPAVFQKQQVAALAAGQQDKMWYFVELFYHEQGREYTNYVTESYLDGLAKQVPGLNLAEWMAARS